MTALTVKIEHAPLLIGSWAGPNITQTSNSYVAPDTVYAVIGPAGANGSPASISSDADNQLTLGTDNNLYMGNPALETAQW